MSELRPGSPDARRAGCKCSQVVNKQGHGAFITTQGETRFVLDARCPLHSEAK